MWRVFPFCWSPRPTAAAAVMMLLALPQAATAVPIICSIDQKFVCRRDGCVPGPTSRFYNRIDFERGVYARCDGRGCDEYSATISQSGAYINIELPRRTAFAKLSDTRNDPLFVEQLQALHLVESVSMGLVVWISYGTCHEIHGQPKGTP
jgi:hypothetical protein